MTTISKTRGPVTREDSFHSQDEFRKLLGLYHAMADLDMAVMAGKPETTIKRLKGVVLVKYQAVTELYEGKESSTVSRRHKNRVAA